MRSDPTKTDISEAVFEVATRANDQLETAKSYIESSLDQPQIISVLAAVPLFKYLAQLEAVNFNLWDPRLQKKSLSLPFSMMNAYRKGRI
jgi:hypothetical protein